MPVKIDNPTSENITVDDYHIETIMIHESAQELDIHSFMLDSEGKNIGNDFTTLSGPAFVSALTEFITLAASGTQADIALKTALYNGLLALKGKTGVIS